METTLREESALAVCLSVTKHVHISFTELILRKYITFHCLIIFHWNWKSSVEKLLEHLYLKTLFSLCWSCSWPVYTLSVVLNRRQSLFPSAFLIFFSIGSHVTFLVMEEGGISLLFGSVLFLPCSKQSRDLSAVMDTHVILVWWDLLFSSACLKISLSFLSPCILPCGVSILAVSTVLSFCLWGVVSLSFFFASEMFSFSNWTNLLLSFISPALPSFILSLALGQCKEYPMDNRSHLSILQVFFRRCCALVFLLLSPQDIPQSHLWVPVWISSYLHLPL